MRYHFVNASSGNLAGSAYLNNIARCDWVRDRNGNKVNIDYPTGNKVVYTDQLGRQTIVEFGVSDSQFPNETLALRVTLPGYNGSSRYYKVRTGLMNQNYRSDYNPALPVYNGAYPTGVVGTELFADSYEVGTERIDDKPVLTQLVLPDTRTLTFKYNTFGEVAEVQLPTGGKVQYDTLSVPLDTINGNGLPSGNSLAPEVIAAAGQAGGNVKAVDRAVVARRTYPDGSTLEGTWSYSYKITKTEVKCTSGGITLLDEWHYFLPAQRFLEGSTSTGADGTGYSLWSTGVERRSEMVDTNGTTVLSASEQDWSQRISVQAEGKWTTGYSIQEVANDNQVSETRKYLDDGSMTKTDTFYDSSIAASNHINNPSNVYEYDFDGTTVKRHSATTYVTDSTYTSIGVNTVNLLSLPLQQSVYDGSGGELSRTSYEYDNYTADAQNNHAALQSYAPDAYNHDSGYGFTYTTRGNATQITRMINISTFTHSYPRYDTLGNVVSTKDPRTNITTISYQDDFGNGSNPGFGTSGSFGATYSLPSLITSPPPNPEEPAHTARTQFDFNTGLLTGFKDRNGTITQTIYNDPFDRPTQIKAGLGATFGTPPVSIESHTAIYYAGLNPLTVFGVTLTNNDVLRAKDQGGIDDGTLQSWTHTDGFGRTKESWTHDPQGDIHAVSTYDGMGRVSTTSNPFRTGETEYDTTTTYDLVGRVKTVKTADLAMVSTDYSGNLVTVTDQASKTRSSITDALGRLIQVTEDPGTGHLNYQTTYGYDALDDLTGVTQSQSSPSITQTRTFLYDGLKRLTDATNPESGHVQYAYDENGNLSTKTDARLITTNYAYDTLNRVKMKSYQSDPNGTPAVTYLYDAQALPILPTGAPSFSRGSSIGRLVAAIYGSGNAGTYQGYDQMGRVVQSIQVTETQATGSPNPQAYGFTYGYNIASEMLTETYPSGRIIQTEYDTAGRVAGVGNQGAPTYYAGAAASDAANRIQYASHGAVSAMKLGNGKWEHTTYDPKRLQPTLIGLGTSSTDSSVVKLDYAYGTTSNNGNVVSQTITMPGLTLTQCYGYDSLNRLSTADEHSGTACTGTQQWKQAFTYDRYGNRNFDVANTTTNVLGPNPTIDQLTNRFATGQNYGYDSAGNLTSDPTTPATNGIVYDAENRQTQYIKTGQSTNSYYYDGDGHRVKKINSTGTTVFVYNVHGQLIAEYTSGPPSGGGGTSYLTSDHLGSTRAVMKSDGTISRHDFLPFGEEIQVGIGGRTTALGYVADSLRQKFTQKERDNESGTRLLRSKVLLVSAGEVYWRGSVAEER
jgi:YD repeat-containing protein